jgi:hypothetical protein
MGLCSTIVSLETAAQCQKHNSSYRSIVWFCTGCNSRIKELNGPHMMVDRDRTIRGFQLPAEPV